ncbi:hypothetical protein BDF14DRAFT_1231180 [Spinellus fusiger]|nr:hypothetical protein BDF14DRAFT_1231180 [Spinellus fusiger]
MERLFACSVLKTPGMAPMSGDFKVVFLSVTSYGKPSSITTSAATSTTISPCKVHLAKREIDMAHSDIACHEFDPAFSIEIEFEVC